MDVVIADNDTPSDFPGQRHLPGRAVEALKLLPLLGLAFFLALSPKFDYAYPVHLDEWQHLAYSNEIIATGSVTEVNSPYSGGFPLLFQRVEAGFHVFLATVHQVTGIDWLVIFRFFPAIIFMLTVLAAYVLGKRKGFGWGAALMTCLIPTTVGVLGPAYLVPVAMGLAFISLSLFVAFYFKGWGTYAVLLILSFFLFSIHAATAVALILIIVPYVIFNLRDKPWHGLLNGLALTLPFVISLIAFPGIRESLLVPTLENITAPQADRPWVDLPGLILTFGYLPTLLCLAGAAIMMLRGDRIDFGMVWGLIVLLLMFVTFQYFNYGIWIMYGRSFQYIWLLMSVIAGAGLIGILRFKVPERLSLPERTKGIFRQPGKIIFAVVLAAVLFTAIPARLQQYHYRMISERDYVAFTWIKNNLGKEYEKAVLDPRQGAAFTAITGKYVYAWIGERVDETDEAAYEFLANDCADTGFLRDNGISIVYTRGECDNPDLTRVGDCIYILE